MVEEKITISMKEYKNLQENAALWVELQRNIKTRDKIEHEQTIRRNNQMDVLYTIEKLENKNYEDK